MPEADYLDITGAYNVLKDMGVVQSREQVRGAVERGKLPFFKDPVTGKRMISRRRLLDIYYGAQASADRAVHWRQKTGGKRG